MLIYYTVQNNSVSPVSCRPVILTMLLVQEGPISTSVLLLGNRLMHTTITIRRRGGK
jgi:hypothetical protein